MTGYIILAVALVSIIACLLFIFLKSSYPRFKHKKSGEFRGFSATIWAENKELLDKCDANKAAKAAYALATSWRYMNFPDPDKADNLLKKTGVLVLTKETFPKWGYYPADVVSSVQLWTKNKIFDKRIPLVAMHEGTISRLSSATGESMPGGQPVIHELLHAVLDDVAKNTDYRHTDNKFWARSDDKIQLEEEASYLFRKLP